MLDQAHRDIMNNGRERMEDERAIERRVLRVLQHHALHHSWKSTFATPGLKVAGPSPERELVAEKAAT